MEDFGMEVGCRHLHDGCCTCSHQISPVIALINSVTNVQADEAVSSAVEEFELQVWECM
jgi:hypothetical protein